MCSDRVGLVFSVGVGVGMSVMSCSRRGCRNIMCDRHSYEYGYICNECYDELVELGLGVDIEEFMNTPKETTNSMITETAEKLYDSIFSFAIEEA